MGGEELLGGAVVGDGELGEVAPGDGGEGGVEFDADDGSRKGDSAGDEEGAAFAGADVEEGGAVDGEGGARCG